MSPLTIAQLLQQHDIRANKALGQHFLLDTSITDKMLRYTAHWLPPHIVEIGPGPGALTCSILRHPGLKEALLVEMDSRFLPLLEHHIQQHQASDHCRVMQADALQLSLGPLMTAPYAIIGNLPYNIASPLLMRWLQALEGVAGMVLMVQREMAERWTAAPHSKAYNRLSVMIQWTCRAECLFHVPPSVFHPAPKVESTVVQVRPIHIPHPDAWKMMDRLCRAAFQQRRKKIKTSLASVVPDVEAVCQAVDIDPALRAEDLTVSDYVRLMNHLLSC